MSFRKVGGVQYSATQNVVKSRYNTSDNLYVSQYVGEPNTYINFLSDISGNQIYGDLDVSGNLYVSGDIDCSGNLYTDKDAYINDVRVGRGGGNISNNTVVGHNALNTNTIQGSNTAIGYLALQHLDASCNTAVGNLALYTNNSGPYNTAIGNSALRDLSSAGNCVAVGHGALTVTNGNRNTAVGSVAMNSSTSGNDNVAIGSSSLQYNLGNNNTAVGSASLFNNTIGVSNVAIGYHAGYDLSGNSQYNTFLGDESNVSSNLLTYNNSTAIGNNAIVNASNKIRLGNTNVTVIEGQVAFTNPSDARDKINFIPLDAGLNFINELNPIRFDWNQRGGGLEGRKDIGFTAQELLLAQEKTKIPIPNLVDESNPDKYHVMYTQLIPILVKAVQEMSSTITRLEAEINELKSKI